MTKANITQYDNTAANNTDVQDVPLGENQMYPADVNNAFRELMADLADMNDGTVTLTSPSFAAASLTGDLSFGDNDKAIFGAGSDLQIYHDGSNSYIRDIGTGNLNILADQLKIMNAAGTENKAFFVSDAGVYLYHNNSARLETTSTGIDVTGTVTADGLTVDGATDSTEELARFGNNAGTQELIIEQQGSSGYAIKSSVDLRLHADYDSDTSDGGSNIEMYTDGTQRMSITGSTGDISFYEDTGTTAKLFWDASAERLGLGTSSPSRQLHVSGSGANTRLRVENTTGSNVLDVYAEDGGNSTLNYSSVLTMSESGTERMRIDTSGNLLVGKTSTSDATTTVGFHVQPSGVAVLTRDGGAPLRVSRKTSDGEIVSFHKDGTTVGSIDNDGANRLIVNSENTTGYLAVDGAVKFRWRTNDFIPHDNGTKDLGSSATRWRDLYLSDGLRADTLTFSSLAGSERMRIDSSGVVLVGKTSADNNANGVILRPSSYATFTNTSARAIIANRKTSDGSIIDFRKDNSTVGSIGSYSGTGLTLSSGGELRFFTSTSNEDMRLETDGDLHVDGNVVAYSTTISDIRLKKDIAPIEDAVTKVQQLNGCTFTYLKDDRKSAGLIAQDVEKVLPSAVIEDEAVFHGEEGETYKTVQYDQLIGLLVEAVKELSAKVEKLENASSK